MQTITIPWTSSTDDRTKAATWQRSHASVVRSGYVNADGRTDKELRNYLKQRFKNHPLGSWAIHCAAAEGARLRRARPEGKMVFGGKSNLIRRQKGLILNEEWQELRHLRSIEIIGDRTRWGNRHFRLSEDGLSCKATFLKQEITLSLPEMTGKDGKLVRAVAKLADACEISVQFSLGKTHLSITFDPMDLRKLPPRKTLEQVKIAEQGASRRGRKRTNPETHDTAHRIKPIPSDERPVHPEWRPTISMLATRAIGIDLNPQWIGITVIETSDSSDVNAVKILDHQLHHIDIPVDAPREQMQQAMACVARSVISLARAWNVSLIVHEDGLGRLRSGGKNKKLNQVINYWSRNAFLGGLGRRAALSGLTVKPVWGGYSTTIGNLCFNLPDACSSAAEIARRGLAVRSGYKNRLPAVPLMVHLRRWKDGELPDASVKALAQATCWQEVHRTIKSAKTIGYRRLHPTPKALGSGNFILSGRSYAVDRIGKGKGASCSARPVLTRAIRNSSDWVAFPERNAELKSE